MFGRAVVENIPNTKIGESVPDSIDVWDRCRYVVSCHPLLVRIEFFSQRGFPPQPNGNDLLEKLESKLGETNGSLPTEYLPVAAPQNVSIRFGIAAKSASQR